MIALDKEEMNPKKAVEKMKPVKASRSPPNHQHMKSKSPIPEILQDVLNKYGQELYTQHNITVDLSNEDSIQHQALSWLAFSDQLVTTPEDPLMVERYVLAVLYYATNGAEWINNNGWLADYSICSWFGVEECSDGYVTNIDLGKNSHIDLLLFF